MYSKYRLDGSLSDLRNEMTKTPEKMTLEASFADDTALMARKESDLYVIVNKLLKLFVKKASPFSSSPLVPPLFRLQSHSNELS